MRKLEKIVVMLLVSNEMSTGTFGWTHHPNFVGSEAVSCRARRSFLTTSYRSSQISDTSENATTGETPFPGIDSARELYPHWNVLFNGTLQVDPTHTLSYQILGEPKSAKQDSTTMPETKKLVGLFLHGGPGAGCFPNHARFFDPERYYRVVLLDQRGCGKSTPTGCLTDNTLQDLVEDCEKLKNHLQIPHWDVVLGGSWGTTVAIAYGQSYPESVRSMILRGVFLLRAQEIDWLFSSTGGVAEKYPTIFKSFCEAVGIHENGAEGHDQEEVSPLAALHEHTRRLWEAPSEEERNKAARSWMQWEFFNSVAHKIPPSTNLSDSNVTMQAIRSWQPPDVPPVAVTSKSQGATESENKWSFQSLDQREIPQEVLSRDLQDVVSDDTSIQAKFRRDISSGYNTGDPPRAPVHIRTPTISYYVKPEGAGTYGSREKPDQTNLPVQAMLTSFYSSNCDYCRNYLDLLDPDRMRQLENIPTIIVQGGSDGICPPDSALDLLDSWPTNGMIQLRMPVHGGHSMYDPLVRNELLWAADSLADAL